MSEGIEIKTPYLTKFRYDNLTSYFLSIDVHMMPASAPLGVINAPKLEPTTLAYNAPDKALPLSPSIIGQKSTLIGILLIKFADKYDVTPYLSITFSSPKRELIAFVTPALCNAKIIINIDKTKGINCHGARFKQFNTGDEEGFFVQAQSLFLSVVMSLHTPIQTNNDIAEINDTSHISKLT